MFETKLDGLKISLYAEDVANKLFKVFVQHRLSEVKN